VRTHLLGGGGAGELGPIAAVRIVVADGHGDLEGVVGQQPEWAFEVDPQYGGGARGHVEALLDGSGRAADKMCTELGASKPTVNRAFQNLRECGLIWGR
jgi:hypothetical protein